MSRSSNFRLVEVKGIFHDKGYMAEKEVFDTAFQLHLVGWLKVRATFILGHVQGDTYALSYFKKYLEEKHLSREAGTIDWVRLWEYNTGLEVPLSYRVLWTGENTAPGRDTCCRCSRSSRFARWRRGLLNAGGKSWPTWTPTAIATTDGCQDSWLLAAASAVSMRLRYATVSVLPQAALTDIIREFPKIGDPTPMNT
eukprot:s1860_g1.t1